MARKITVVLSQGQSVSPDKRKLEEDLVTGLLFERGLEVTVIPHLYDLTADGTAMLCLSGITGDMVILSWLFPRAAHWTLARNGIKGKFGATLLQPPAEDGDEVDSEEKDADEAETTDESDSDEAGSDESENPRVGPGDTPNRTIYHLDLRWHRQAAPYLDEIKRIASETSVETIGLMSWIQGTPAPEQIARFLNPTNSMTTNGMPAAAPSAADSPASANGNGQPPEPLPQEPVRIEETAARRWYPVIDYSRCTNCMECIDFCLFGVYGVDRAETILVEQPDNCRKGCPACSRVCPENAIIFPQHKSPAIAGSPDENAGGLKIDLSLLFGGPSAIEVAAQERDVELVAVGRDAVGLTIGIPKRQDGKPAGPKDDLDDLMDQLDAGM